MKIHCTESPLAFTKKNQYNVNMYVHVINIHSVLKCLTSPFPSIIPFRLSCVFFMKFFGVQHAFSEALRRRKGGKEDERKEMCSDGKQK